MIKKITLYSYRIEKVLTNDSFYYVLIIGIHNDCQNWLFLNNYPFDEHFTNKEKLELFENNTEEDFINNFKAKSQEIGYPNLLEEEWSPDDTIEEVFYDSKGNIVKDIEWKGSHYVERAWYNYSSSLKGLKELANIFIESNP